MKLIQFDGRHRLYYEGFNYGYRFSFLTASECVDLHKKLVDHFGEPGRGKKWGYFETTIFKPFWIGFKEKKDATFALLL